MTLAGGHRSLASLWRSRVALSGERPFLIFDDLAGGVERYTYGEFDARVQRTAGALLALGVGRGDRIGLHLDNRVEFLALWMAAAHIGVVIMPTNTAATVDELGWLLGHSGCRLLFTQARYAPEAGAAAAGCEALEEMVICGAPAAGRPSLQALVEEAPAPVPHLDIEPGDDAAILYTSGTTARPKGVQVSHANYIHAGETVAKAIRLAPDDRHLVVLPLFHGNAQYYSTMSTLVSGASMVLAARFSASAYFALAIRHRCTVASLFAAPIRMLLAQPENAAWRDNALRVVLHAQNITPAQEMDWARRFDAPLLQLWGMTETMGPPLMNPVDGERRNQSMGLPALGYQVELLDADGVALTSVQGAGEIAVRGLPGWSLMKGYYRNPEASAETLRGEWLHSGDRARRDADGYFHFVDRAKDMIKRSGENVAASEVEAVLMAHPAVFDCAVIGVPDALRDEAIKAVVVLHPGAEADAGVLRAWCAARLAKFRVPEHYEFRDRLPRTAVGKIQKHLLRGAPGALSQRRPIQ